MPKQKRGEPLRTFTEATVSQICQTPRQDEVSFGSFKKDETSLSKEKWAFHYCEVCVANVPLTLIPPLAQPIEM